MRLKILKILQIAKKVIANNYSSSIKVPLEFLRFAKYEYDHWPSAD